MFCFLYESYMQKILLLILKPFFHDRHKACNIFARTYCDLWLEEENVGQEIMIEDLTVRISFAPTF